MATRHSTAGQFFSVPDKLSDEKSELKSLECDNNQAALQKILLMRAETPEEKFKVLDTRDRLFKLMQYKDPSLKRGALPATCPDMCPEKERLLREYQNRGSIFEMTNFCKSYGFNHCLAVKEYARSSADQEEPLPHDLRPVHVLSMTMSHLLHNVVDFCELSDENLEDWYMFVWDRTRAVRKEITQQAICCRESVTLLEQCARFHIHCAERLIDQDSSIYDDKINTDNLTKCLQTLKHMYKDLAMEDIKCPNEAEFVCYTLLLNLNNSSVFTEVSDMSDSLMASDEIKFALDVMTAWETRNYIRFFNLVKKTSYLNCCLLRRYFGEMRLYAIKTMIRSYCTKTYSPQIPISRFVGNLNFEGEEECINFLSYCNFDFVKINGAMTVNFNRLLFQNPQTTLTRGRAYIFIEEKKKVPLSQVLAGGELPPKLYENHVPESSFNENGELKDISMFKIDTVDLACASTSYTPADMFDVKSGIKTDSSVSALLQNPFSKNYSKSIFHKDEPNIFENYSKNIFQKGEPSIFGSDSTLQKKEQESTICYSSLFSNQKPIFSDDNLTNNKVIDFSDTSNQGFQNKFATKVPTTNPFIIDSDSAAKFSQPSINTSSIFGAQNKILPSFNFEKVSNDKKEIKLFNQPLVSSTAMGTNNVFKGNLPFKFEIPNKRADEESEVDKNIESEIEKTMENEAETETETETENENENENSCEAFDRVKVDLNKSYKRKRYEDLEEAEEEEAENENKKKIILERKNLSEEIFNREAEEKEREEKANKERIKQMELAKLEMERQKQLEEEEEEKRREAEAKLRILEKNKQKEEMEFRKKIDNQMNKLKKNWQSWKTKLIFEKWRIRTWTKIEDQKMKQYFREAKVKYPPVCSEKLLNGNPYGLVIPNSLVFEKFQNWRKECSTVTPKSKKLLIVSDELPLLKVNIILGKLLEARARRSGYKSNQYFWKLVFSVPDESECPQYWKSIETFVEMHFIDNINWEFGMEDGPLYCQSGALQSFKFSISIRKLRGCKLYEGKQSDSKAADGCNALIFFITESGNDKTVQRLKAVLRSKPPLPKIPLILFNLTHKLNEDVETIKRFLGVDAFLNSHITEVHVVTVSNEKHHIIHQLKKSLELAAGTSALPTPLRMVPLSDFFTETRLESLWRRIGIGLSNFNIKLEEPRVLIEFYNFCVDQLISIFLTDSYSQQGVITDEFLNVTVRRPKKTLAYEEKIKQVLNRIKLPHWPAEIPKSSHQLNYRIHQYCKKIVENEKLKMKTLKWVLYRIIRRSLLWKGLDIYCDEDIKEILINFPWIQVFQEISRIKICQLKEEIKNDQELAVVYNQKDIEMFTFETSLISKILKKSKGTENEFNVPHPCLEKDSIVYAYSAELERKNKKRKHEDYIENSLQALFSSPSGKRLMFEEEQSSPSLDYSEIDYNFQSLNDRLDELKKQSLKNASILMDIQSQMQ